MKKLANNIKLGIYESVALLFAILTLSFTFLPAYFEDGQKDLSLFNIMLGNTRINFSPILLIGFICIIVAVVIIIAIVALLFLNKISDKNLTILTIVSASLILIGSIILACAIFVSGLDKLNSELGFTQGIWGFKIGNILVPVFGILTAVVSYPAALVILSKQEQQNTK